MQAVRGFAAYLQTTDPDVEIPPPGLLPGGPRRAVPYLYSPADIAALLGQAGRLKTPLRQQTLRTLIGLMTVTAIRGGEVAALDDDDFDAARGLLLVRHAKLGRRRLLPLRATTVTALLAYRQLRDQWFPRRRSEALLVSSAGTKAAVLQRRPDVRPAGPPGRTGRPVRGLPPAAADLRHSFAVSRLLDWCRDEGDIAARMPLLSAYLGQASPDLLAEAARRLGPLPGEPR